MPRSTRIDIFPSLLALTLFEDGSPVDLREFDLTREGLHRASLAAADWCGLPWGDRGKQMRMIAQMDQTAAAVREYKRSR